MYIWMYIYIYICIIHQAEALLRDLHRLLLAGHRLSRHWRLADGRMLAYTTLYIYVTCIRRMYNPNLRFINLSLWFMNLDS